MRIVSAGEMRDIDQATSESFGVPSIDLMEHAGAAAADLIAERFPRAQRVLVICGKGNNGGDGFTAARLLMQAGRKVDLLLLAKPSELRGDAARMYRLLKAKKPTVAATAKTLQSPAVEKLFQSAELIVDALLGTGFKPPLREPYDTAIRLVNESKAPVVSIDVPSGADADSFTPDSNPCVQADTVVTFTAPKPAHIFRSDFAVPTLIAPIGSPEEALRSRLGLHLTTFRDLPLRALTRPPDSHKGSFGHVLIFGGSCGKAGAAAMAGMACLRTGAGLTTIATPKSVLPLVAGFAPELMTEALDETSEGTVSSRASEAAVLDSLLNRKTVLAIGPGLSLNLDVTTFVRALMDRARVPVILDADGLNAFAGAAAQLQGRRFPLVLTPHPGEMSRLTGLPIAKIQSDGIAIARDFACKHGLILVLKGWRTLIAQPDGEVWVNATGNPGLAKGGSGDVLTGLIAALMAQLPGNIPAAVRMGVYLHGLAADLAQLAFGTHSMVATDVIERIPNAFVLCQQMAMRNRVWIRPGIGTLAGSSLI